MKAEHDDVFKGMMTSRDKAEVWTLLRRHMTESLMASVTFAESTFRQITDGLLKEDIKSLRKAEKPSGRKGPAQAGTPSADARHAPHRS